MKTQRRHELQTNVLASSLARWIEAAKPYSRAGLAVLIAIVVALFAWAYMSTQSSRQLSDGWNEYFDAINGRNPDPREQLRDISTRYTGTIVGQWARLTLADYQLDDGTNRLLRDRKAAREVLNEASGNFQALQLESTHPTILQRADYGLARAYEALGELDKARNGYRSLAEKWPEGPFAVAAESRADDLDELRTKKFYDWLAKYEPPPPLSKEPGTPGAGPSFLDEPDAGGILDMPSLIEKEGGPALPSVTEGAPLGEPEGEAPTPDDSPATDAAPADKPADAPQPEAATEPSQPAEPAPEQDPASDEAGPELK